MQAFLSLQLVLKEDFFWPGQSAVYHKGFKGWRGWNRLSRELV